MLKVFMATPVYDGKVIEQFKSSLKDSLEFLKQKGIPAHWESLSGCCYLPIARNMLVKKFLESDFTDMIFIDSDIEWSVDALVRLLQWPVEIVAGPYRHKTWEETYPIWYRTDEAHRPITGGLSGLINCWTIPTGFMRISRSVFEAMDRHYGDSLDIEEYTTEAELKGSYRNYFDTGPFNKQWWGEDCNFCRHWTMEMGRNLWIDPNIELTHWGTATNGQDKPFHGNYHQFLSRMPGGRNDPGYHENKIEGYTVISELQWLFNQAKQMKSVVEIGSYFGRSSHALLSGCPGVVTCVDMWKPLQWEDGDDAWKAEERFKHFLENTSSFPNRAVLRMESTKAVEMFQDGSIDMVFIDGDHEQKSVEADIAAWLPKTKKMICGHDYDYVGWPKVKEAVDLFFGDRVRVHGTIWYVDLQEG